MLVLQARGTFDVTLEPQPPGGELEAAGPARMTIAKQFHGDLQGFSHGQMLAIMTAIPDSAGYVALENVDATLGGRRGRFALQHSGTMQRGTPQLVVSVVPDSGTDGLLGLSGRMAIEIVDGEHRYAFDYTLPTGD